MNPIAHLAELLDNRRYLMAQVNDLNSKIQREATNIPLAVIVAEMMGVVRYNFPVSKVLRDRLTKMSRLAENS